MPPILSLKQNLLHATHQDKAVILVMNLVSTYGRMPIVAVENSMASPRYCVSLLKLTQAF